MTFGNNRVPASRLSAIDAFFVAYQQQAGILMQLGGEIDLQGELHRDELEQMIRYLVARWPRLGQTIKKDLAGLKWSGDCLTKKMLFVRKGREELDAWRNEPIDPFQAPPFQVCWVTNGQRSTLAFRAHHAVMDGESFVAVTAEAANILTQIRSGKSLPSTAAVSSPRLSQLISFRQLIRRNKLGPMWRYTRWLASEARADNAARLAVAACTTGDTGTCERMIDRDVFTRLQNTAATARLAPTWFYAAAWIRAIHAWNVLQGHPDNPLVSLEFPVSLRRGRNGDGKLGPELIGNFISPLVLTGDATQPLVQLACELRKQLMQGIRSKLHLAIPLLTAPARYIPWSLFRRVAVNPGTTGFATSHFTSFELADVYADMARLSDGGLRLTGQRIYTPVCLRMGAAAAVLSSPDRAQIFVTYRVTALSHDAAFQLLDLMVTELEVAGGLRSQKMKSRHAVS